MGKIKHAVPGSGDFVRGGTGSGVNMSDTFVKNMSRGKLARTYFDGATKGKGGGWRTKWVN